MQTNDGRLERLASEVMYPRIDITQSEMSLNLCARKTNPIQEWVPSETVTRRRLPSFCLSEGGCRKLYKRTIRAPGNLEAFTMQDTALVVKGIFGNCGRDDVSSERGRLLVFSGDCDSSSVEDSEASSIWDLRLGLRFQRLLLALVLGTLPLVLGTLLGRTLLGIIFWSFGM
jgi:hypothetical protein